MGPDPVFRACAASRGNALPHRFVECFFQESIMRRDMDKVIVERPRIGSRLPSRKKGYRKHLQTTGLENLPKREPMLGRWGGRGKWLNEHLGPMRRFLRSRIGRPWNKVHQELCEHVSFDNAVQKHVLSHVFDYVQKHVAIEGRKVLSIGEWRHGRILEPGAMYVCPNTGLLKEVRREKYTHSPRRIYWSQLTQYQQRDGAWWELKLQPRPADPGEAWDLWLERKLSQLKDADLHQAFGGKLTAVSKRPLSPAEVRELHRGLRKNRRAKKSRTCS
jgi:hypothetical protein